MFRRALVVLALGALAAPAGAAAANYPPPGNPGPVKGHPKGKLTLHVCHTGKTGRYRFRSIQKAVNFAGRGDTVRVCNGSYRESIEITGARKAGLKLIGNPAAPRKVVLDLRTLKGADKQNGVIANGANDVTMSGFYARHYTANGFFAVNVDGYLMNRLVAGYGGKYGLYAFNAKGGTMSNSEAFYNNDSGFYVGQTPKQTKPKQTFVTRARSWGNVLGFSGTNMRYVTITKGFWWNNGLGIVPNTLSTERFPPEENNTIIDNDIFWNNFNYLRGAPFKAMATASDATSLYPVGIGLLLFGGRNNVVKGNRFYGNYLAGAGMIDQIILAASKKKELREASVLRNNEFRGNAYGLGGKDLNGHDVVYPGSGTGNCVAEGASLTDPIGTSTFRGCPFTGTNTKDDAALTTVLKWATVPDAKKPITLQQFWRPEGHPAKPGYTPLVACRKTATGCAGQPTG